VRLRDLLANTWTPDKEPLVEAYRKQAAQANAKAREATGMDVAPAKFDLEEWMPILRKLAVLLVTVLMSYGAASHEESAQGQLQATASAATEKQRLVEMLGEEYESFEDFARYYTTRAAACDTALEAFARHRDDERDWAHVLEECYSGGEIAESP
jgi:hypothetical protein